MTLEEAIKTAIECEKRIRDVYREAANKASDPIRKSFLKAMRTDEENHLLYLKEKLEQWQSTGKITTERLESVIPSVEAIARKTGEFKNTMSKKSKGDHKRTLSRALKTEMETSRFYEEMVDEMPPEYQGMFANFLEIENRHIAVVQAELDYESKSGYWFDLKEFDME